MKMKVLDYTLIGLLTGITPPLTAQDAARIAPQAEAATDRKPTFDCTDGICEGEEGVLLKVQTRSYDNPVTRNTSENSSGEALQPDRRVAVAQVQPGRASASGNFSAPLPNGGIVWATEDPVLGLPELSISSPSVVAFDGQHIVDTVRFMVRSNYPAFIKHFEINIYRGDDGDLVEPIATIPLPVAAVSETEWDGSLPARYQFRTGDELVYVLRAYGDNGHYDETFPRTLQLVRPEDATSASQRLRRSAAWDMSSTLTPDEAETQSLLDQVFSANGLQRQTIPVYGSRVRIQGRDVPRNQRLFINGDSYPVDMEDQFVAEFLMPIGRYSFDIALQNTGEGGETSHHPLNVDVTGRYFFGVAIADITIAGNDIDGSTDPFREDELYDDDMLADGRLAFYLKAKTRGKYLITAQADTTEKELEDLFDDFTQADPRDVFRRLDPDLYYPTYGDDSTTYRDVDTQGRFYFRVDWDKNQALWGNYATGLTGTDYAQYVRSLYGAAFSWSSLGINAWGDPNSKVRLFGSQPESAPGHNEFLGTGGSLYYLKHTDILPGSDVVVLEVRDPTTGRVERRVNLERGADYEIDELQGRIILTRALSQITRQNVPTLTRDEPLDGFEQRLIVDYEWVPSDFDDDEMTLGGRGKHWFGDHVGLGATYVDENRAGEDYELAAGDLTLQAGRGTYLKAEYSHTESLSAPSLFSDNGGFNFALLNDPLEPGHLEGDGKLVEARANFRELGWTHQQWSAGAWSRKTEPGFAARRYDTNLEVTEYGAEVLGDILPNLSLYARHSDRENGPDTFRQTQASLRWRIDDRNALGGEVRHVDEDSIARDGSGLLGAIEYSHLFGSSLELYGLLQGTLEESGDYEDNNLAGVGARYQFGNMSSAGGEITSGDRGDAVTLDGEYRVNPDYDIYAGYTYAFDTVTYSTDTTEYPSLFHPDRESGWTFGQRIRLSNQVSLFNESQYLKEPNQTGLAHTFGMDFYPATGWNLGYTLQSGELIDIDNGKVDRKAVSIRGGRRSPATDWQSKIEWRKDTGFERRTQWVSTNRVAHKINESWRVAGRLNYSDTDDDLNPEAGAKFIEGNFGFAWRPWDSQRWGLFGRTTYLYDLATLAQWGGADYDQKTAIASFEGVYKFNPKWEFAAKLARREGEVRMGRGSGPWFDSATTFSAVQLRRDLGHCRLLAEYRWLDVEDGGTRDGGLVSCDRKISDNFRIGIGYNLTDFSDDLTDFDYDHRGGFINFVGSY